MFALIIGINIYKNNDWPNLRGAVSDARAIESYLMDGLRVDKSRIRMLLDEEATRQGIIDALVALRDNDDIEHGEAILIYYAGNGGEISTLDSIKYIAPQDFDEGKEITNQTFVWLIEDIMRKRGDNVVCPGERIFGYIPNDLFPLDRHPRLRPLRGVWRFLARLTRSLRCKRGSDGK
jgi:hypothetical protein